jgi:sulfatase maturation enzyme AslB (radical SAM superfamily)
MWEYPAEKILLMQNPPPSPQFLYLEINTRCNLRCQHCMYWTNSDEDKPNYLANSRREEIMREFVELGGTTLVSCGGEPMMDLDDYFTLSQAATRTGLKFFSVTNGTMVTDAAMAERVITEGPSEITVSLNSHRKDVHDTTRGEGSFDAAVMALRLLLAARERLASTKRIYAMAVICEPNWRDLDPFFEFVLHDIRADKLKLNIIQPTFEKPGAGTLTKNDAFFKHHMISDPEAFVQVVEACDKKYNLGIDPQWISTVRMYLESMLAAPDREKGWASSALTRDHICNTGERNIMVNRYGLARLCFSSGFRGVQISEPGDLKRFWENSHDIRQEMAVCNRPCGVSHSVRAVSATVSANRLKRIALRPPSY